MLCGLIGSSLIDVFRLSNEGLSRLCRRRGFGLALKHLVRVFKGLWEVITKVAWLLPYFCWLG